MLKISKLADYATSILSHLLLQPESWQSAKVLAEHLGLKQPTVSKILKLLAESSILQAKLGVNGGYRLARSSDQISLADIITAIDGRGGITACAQDQVCSYQAHCRIKTNWRYVDQAIYQTLSALTLADMQASMHEHPVVLHGIQLSANQGASTSQRGCRDD